MPNTPGDVDPGYTGEILVNYKPRVPRKLVMYIDKLRIALNKVININLYFDNILVLLEKELNPPYGAGEAIAQCYLTPHPDIKFNVVDKLPETERGEGGHGSTQTNNH